MNNRVVITGLGVITSIGIGWKEFWDNLLKGKSGISPVSSFDTTNYFTHNGGEVKNFRPEDFIDKETIPYLSRATQLALAAAQLSIEDANLKEAKTNNIAVCLGTTNGSTQAIEYINDLIVANNKSEIKEQLVCRIPTNTTPSFVSKARSEERRVGKECRSR